MLIAICLSACSSSSSGPYFRADTAVSDTTTPDIGEQDITSADTDDDEGDAPEASDGVVRDVDTSPPEAVVRFASYNASMFRDRTGQLETELRGGEDAQAQGVAALLQEVRPDVVLINEFDGDGDDDAARAFVEEYLAVAQGNREPLDYGAWFVPRSNTGQPSGVDLNRDGRVVNTQGTQQWGEDAFGFGRFPGQYGMLVLSRFPIGASRTFQLLRWVDMPDHLLPTDYYSAEAQEVFRLSSKNHIDVSIAIGEEVVHLLGSHPTPPSFDGPEDRNGRRNHDEIRFWVDYIGDAAGSEWIRDDNGAAGGLPAEAAFVIVGDLNSDPEDGGSRQEAIQSLLNHPRVNDTLPRSEGGVEAAERDGGANAGHGGEPGLDTADFSDRSVGNLRVDYCLPSSGLEVVDSGVFWPASASDNAALVDVSDHRLVWVDVRVPFSQP